MRSGLCRRLGALAPTNRAKVGGGFMDFARSRVAIAVVALASLWLLAWPEGRGVPSSAQEAKSSPQIWTVPEIGALPDDANGRQRPLPAGAPEMQALVAYIKFLSTGVAPGQLLPGMGTGNMPELDRAADPALGEALYANACLTCHGPNGAGIRRSLPTTDLGYMMPPLWGNDSFNDGAGMARLITAANFLHFNMPHGVDYLNPQLSPEQAWDIAAYVLSQPRPHKAGLDKDFPDLLEKPVDAPYGPYADGFSEQQHKYGPFAPIRAAIVKLKAEKAGGPSPPPR